MARMAAANGIEDRARSLITAALDGPGLQQGYVLTEVARAYGHLDETGHAFAFAEKAFVLGEDEEDEEGALETIRAISALAGLDSEMESRVQERGKRRLTPGSLAVGSEEKKDRKGKGKRRR